MARVHNGATSQQSGNAWTAHPPRKHRGRRAFFRTVLIITGFLTLNATVIFAGRPLITDDAEPVAPGNFEFEAGVGYCGDGAVRTVDFPVAFTMGLVESLELSVGSGGQVQVDSAGTETDTTGDWLNAGLGLKWKFLDDDAGLFCFEHLEAFHGLGDHALSVNLCLPASTRSRLGTGEVDLDVVYILTKSLTEQINGHVNLAYTYLGDEPKQEIDDIFRAGIALDYQWTSHLQPVVEIVTLTPVSSDGDTDVGVNTGLRWAVLPNLILDAAVGTGLTRNWPDLTATVGFTWSFPNQ